MGVLEAAHTGNLSLSEYHHANGRIVHLELSQTGKLFERIVRLQASRTRIPPPSGSCLPIEWFSLIGIVWRWTLSMSDVGHYPARASEATMSNTADRVLGVHGFVRHNQRNARHVKLIRGPASF